MKVLGCVGAGSFGKVLKVQMDSQILALKQIDLSLDAEEQAEEVANLQNQVMLMQSCLYHPNVVRCYSCVRKEGRFYILMEFAGHRTLEDLAGPLGDQKQIVNLVIQLCLGLKHLKSRRIVHRDLKPSNIIISDKGLLKIADFGISTAIAHDNAAKTVLGTPFYTAPEIIRQQNYGFAVDVWSFGVILFEMTHGHLPFLASNLHQLKHKIQFHVPQLKSELHPDLSLILRGCLAKRAEDRCSVEQILKTPLVYQQMATELSEQVQYF